MVLPKHGVDRTTKSGFTLIEILIVIGIMVLLLTIVAVSVSGVRANANDKKRIADLSQVQLALRAYAEDSRFQNRSRYPSFNSGDIIGTDSSGINAALSDYIDGLVADPLSGTSGYNYYYDSSYSCNGQNEVVIYADSMQRDGSANHDEICGTSNSDRYILILR